MGTSDLDPIRQQVRFGWLAGHPAETIRVKCGLAIGHIGELVVDMGLPLRDHNLRLLDRAAAAEDLRMD